MTKRRRPEREHHEGGSLQSRRACLQGLGAIGLGLGAAALPGCGFEILDPHGQSRQAAGTTMPNILLVLTDQERSLHLPAGPNGPRDLRELVPDLDLSVRANALSADGYNVVEFTDAYCTSPICSPSRAGLMTGLYPGRREGTTGVTTNVDGIASFGPELSPDICTIADVLKGSGYRTAYFGKWHLSLTTSPAEHGFDEWDQLEAWCGVEVPEHSSDQSIIDKALQTIRRYQEETGPWFVVVSVNNPHDICFNKALGSYDPRFRGWATAYSACLPGQYIDIDPARTRTLPGNLYERGCKPSYQEDYRVPADMPEWRWRHYIAEYAGLIELVNAQLEGLFAEARSADALIVYTSDHGDMAGSHQMVWKGHSLYDENWKVPLIFAHPSLRPSTTCPELISLVDLFPTLAGLAGASDQLSNLELPGVDLSTYLTGEEPSHPFRDRVVGLLGHTFDERTGSEDEARFLFGYRTKEEKRVLYYNADRNLSVREWWEAEIYDMVNDVEEQINLACGASPNRQMRNELGSMVRL